MLQRAGNMIAGSKGIQVALIVIATLLVCTLGTWRSGLSQSEGHRVAPAWEMMATGDWLVPRMFGQLYLRKPPGMFWAIAGMSKVLGQTEFAARSVSGLACLAMALGAWWFARRWFDPRLAIFAGLAQATLPLTWEMGRSAEIEALHAACVQACALSMLHIGLLCGRAKGDKGLVATVVLCGASLAAALLVKGPAGAPVVLAAAIASIVVSREGKWGWLASLSTGYAIAAALIIAAAIAGGVLWLSWRAVPAGESPIVQGPGDFLWDRTKLLNIAGLVPIALATGMPATFAILAVRWRRATSASEAAALALGATCVGSLAIAMVAGVANPRYVIPSLMVASPLVAFALSGEQPIRRWARGVFTGLLVVLTIGGIVFGELSERARNGTGDRASGREVGRALAEALVARGITGPIEIHGDALIEARPEILLSAQRRAAELGLTLTARWTPATHRPLPVGVLAALRIDAEGDETPRLVEEKHVESKSEIGEVLFGGSVGRYRFEVVRIVR